MMNAVNAAVASLAPDEKAKLKSRNIEIKVFYNGLDALQTLKEPSTLPPRPTETGRTWVLPGNNTANLLIATTSIWIFSIDQFNDLNGTIPTSFNVRQISGTTVHELGHQMDRIWAQYNKLSPGDTAIMSYNSTKNPASAQAYAKALTWDSQQRSFDWNLAKRTRFYASMPNGANGLKTNELFAEQFAIVNGGGAVAAEDAFITQNFKCAASVIVYYHAHAGALRPTPDPNICYHHTIW
jgi:hypothetical protein